MPLSSKRRYFRWSRLTASFLLSMAIPWSRPQLRAQYDIPDIAKNVRANETLYEDIDILLRRSYRLGEPKYWDPRLTSSADGAIRQVFQNGLIYFQNDESARRVDGTSYCMDILQAYDGQATRAIEKRATAYIHEARWEDPRLLRPHTLLLQLAEHPRLLRPPAIDHTIHWRSSPPGASLSAYLEPEKSGDHQPAAGSLPLLSGLSMRFDSEDTVDGLRSLKIRCEAGADGQPLRDAELCLIWLTPDRNYLPVKTERYRLSTNTELPTELCRINEFRELAPGVWFPFHASRVRYDEDQLRDNKLVIADSEECTVDKALLNPQYDRSLFQITIPNEMYVRVIRNGRIISTYWHGEHGDIVYSPQTRWLVWAALGSLLALLAGAGLAYHRTGRPPWHALTLLFRH